MTGAYYKILTLMRAVKYELNADECFMLSGRFEQCGIDKRKNALYITNTAHNPPITMTSTDRKEE